MSRSLAQRMARSDRWRERYRTDPDFRLQHINKGNRRHGRPEVDEMPPVGEARPQWAGNRQRNERGRFV